MTAHRALPLAVAALLSLSLASLVYAPAADAVSYPLCGGAPNGTMCTLPPCGTVPAGQPCLRPFCEPGTPIGDDCESAAETFPACSAVGADTLCQPPELECGKAPEGYPCFGTPPEVLPSCDGTLAVDTMCTASDGNACRVVTPGSFACLNVMGEIECSGPLQIVQDCIAGTGATASPLLVAMTDQAIAMVLEHHALPPEDTGLVMGYARDLVRANLLAKLIEIIQKNPRTPEEEEVVHYYAGKVRDLRVRQAHVSEDEYFKYAAGPCSYVAPPGFTFQKPTDCAHPLALLFNTPAHPTLEEFKAYGVAAVNKTEILDDFEVLRAAAGTRDGIILGAGLAGGAIVAASVFALIFVTGLGATLMGALFPFTFAVLGSYIVAGLAVGAAAIAAVVFAVILAIVGSTIAIIQHVEYEQFVSDVTSLVESQQVLPDLRTLIQSDRGMADLFHVYVTSTVPDWPAEGPLPPEEIDAPRFRVTDDAGQLVAFTPSIQLAVPVGSLAGGVSAKLHRGWFRTTITFDDVTAGQVDQTTLTLGIPIIDWNGSAATAWRRGSNFVIARTGADGKQVEPGVETAELRYRDRLGRRRQATVFVDTTPPVITPQVTGSTLNGSGWYVSNVQVAWGLQDPESGIAASDGCDPAVVSQDGEWEFECEATSAGGTDSVALVIKRDTGPPSIIALKTPPANGRGWNNSSVAVTFLCADGGSGIAECPGVRIYDQEGITLPEIAVARDVAGNAAQAGSLLVSIDKTPPDVSIASPASGALFVQGQAVVVDWVATDAVSGIARTNAPAEPGSPLDTSTPGEHKFAVAALDKAGNKTRVAHTYTVLGLAQALSRLDEMVNQSDWPRGVKAGLRQTLAQAASYHANGQSSAAWLMIQSFVTRLQMLVQRGRIDAAEAEVLAALARQLAGALNPIPVIALGG